MKFQLQFVLSPCEVLSPTASAAAQGSCWCCTHRPWLCFAACKSAFVLVTGARVFKNQFLPRKNQLQILITVTGTAEVWFPKLLGTGLCLFQWGQSQLVCTGVQSSTCCCLLSSWYCSPGNHLCLLDCGCSVWQCCAEALENIFTPGTSALDTQENKKWNWKTLLNSCKHGIGWKVKFQKTEATYRTWDNFDE